MLLSYLILSLRLVFPATNQEKYEKAISLIIENEEYVSYCESFAARYHGERYQVSNEIISFYSLGRFFKKELSSRMTIDQKVFYTITNEVSSLNMDLHNLGTKKRAKVKFYFSEVRKGVFFCEVFGSTKKYTRYDQRPIFGQSLIYMFESIESEINLVDMGEIAHN